MIGAIRNVTRDRAVCPLIDESKKKKKLMEADWTFPRFLRRDLIHGTPAVLNLRQTPTCSVVLQRSGSYSEFL